MVYSGGAVPAGSPAVTAELKTLHTQNFGHSHYWRLQLNDRLKGMTLPDGHRPKLIVVHSPSELRANKNNALREGTLFLVDHRFRNDSYTGLQLIAELGLEARAILVTNLFEEPDVIEEVIRLGVRLLPKIYLLNTKFPIDISSVSEGAA